MIWHPVRQLMCAGIGEILVVTSIHHMGSIVPFRSGRYFGCEFACRMQEEPRGIAHAHALAQAFSAGE
jgi:glucose-1-phosphate thymidylyltransferase